MNNPGKYFFGTAGWSYKDWEGIVYPQKKTTRFHALVYLAQYISIVEINSTFYRPPAVQVSLSWLKKVQSFPEFLFTVKLFQVFTHDRKNFSKRDIDQFKMGIEPLHAGGRLAAILIQFPWSFAGISSHYDYLDKLFESFRGFPMALEIRHSSWDTPQFYSLLKTHNVAFCNIDQPIIKNSIKPSAVTTNQDFSYVRLHGRNYKNWFKKDVGRDARYNYLYSNDELDDWIRRIKDLGKKSNKVFVITNNHYQGQYLVNAIQLKNKITGEKLNLPLPLLKKYPALEEIITKIKEGQLDLFDGDSDS